MALAVTEVIQSFQITAQNKFTKPIDTGTYQHLKLEYDLTEKN